MPKGAKPTVNEHYIPRMYLRGFSEITKSGKAKLWQFSLKSMQQSTVQVGVEDICFEKHLYEIKGSDGSYIAVIFEKTIDHAFLRDLILSANQKGFDSPSLQQLPGGLSCGEHDIDVTLLLHLPYMPTGPDHQYMPVDSSGRRTLTITESKEL